MNILIYTCANHEIGMGHLYRMLSLSNLLKEKGNNISFLFPEWKQSIDKIKKKIIRIPVSSFEQKSVYSQLLNNHTFDCLIVDALKVPKEIMELFREKAKVLISLDNIGQGRFFSDILINTLYRSEPKLKKPKIEINDFSYLILNKNFQKINLKEKVINKKVKKILITQGGSDTYGVVPKVIDKLSKLLKDLECYILIGSFFQHDQELKSCIKKNNLKVKILKDVENPWELFYQMDIAITGGGITLFELMCSGVPCLALTQEYKEMETINHLKDLGLIEKIGLYEEIKQDDISNKTLNLINDYEKRIRLSRNGKKIIDGNGCQRTADVITNYFNKLNKQKI